MYNNQAILQIFSLLNWLIQFLTSIVWKNFYQLYLFFFIKLTYREISVTTNYSNLSISSALFEECSSISDGGTTYFPTTDWFRRHFADFGGSMMFKICFVGVWH